MFLWRGELKLSACAFRASFIVLVVCAFNLFTINAFAQDADAEGRLQGEAVTTMETPAVDPITVAEQSLLLGEGGAGTAQPGAATSAWGIFRVILTLALAAAAIYGLVYLVKRAARGGRRQDPFLKVLASTPIATNRSVHIIAAGSQAWLVGAAENGVNLISEIQDKDLLNAIFLEDSRKSADSNNLGGGRFPDFGSLLRRFGVSVEAGPPGPDNIRKRREKLKGL
jgi:flagellar protein FliO/FliZ